MQNEEKKCPSSLRESIHFLSLSQKRQNKSSCFKSKAFRGKSEKHTERRTGVSVKVILCSFVARFNKGSPPLFNLAEENLVSFEEKMTRETVAFLLSKKKKKLHFFRALFKKKRSFDSSDDT